MLSDFNKSKAKKEANQARKKLKSRYKAEKEKTKKMLCITPETIEEQISEEENQDDTSEEYQANESFSPCVKTDSVFFEGRILVAED